MSPAKAFKGRGRELLVAWSRRGVWGVLWFLLRRVCLDDHLRLGSGGVGGASQPRDVSQRRIQGRQRFGLQDWSSLQRSTVHHGFPPAFPRGRLFGQRLFGFLGEALRQQY
jgi:hypothetical protein